jgi:hypothetical protein
MCHLLPASIIQLLFRVFGITRRVQLVRSSCCLLVARENKKWNMEEECTN